MGNPNGSGRQLCEVREGPFRQFTPDLVSPCDLPIATALEGRSTFLSPET